MPAYDATPIYDQSSLGGLEEDVRTVAKVWFNHDVHESIESLVANLPLAYVDFELYDRYTELPDYEMELVRAFIIELNG